MSRLVGIVDYGAGNLLSVQRAVEASGASAILLRNPNDFEGISKLVLPGVGAFGYCVSKLRAGGLFEAVQKFAASGYPMLGICVGMQMLFDFGTENGRYESLGLISGHVDLVSDLKSDRTKRKLPHIGWSQINLTKNIPSSSIVPQEMEGHFMYFAHSYSACPVNRDVVIGTTNYEGTEIVAAVQKGNVYGLQCHPEKSAQSGLMVFQRFVNL